MVKAISENVPSAEMDFRWLAQIVDFRDRERRVVRLKAGRALANVEEAGFVAIGKRAQEDGPNHGEDGCVADTEREGERYRNPQGGHAGEERAAILRSRNEDMMFMMFSTSERSDDRLPCLGCACAALTSSTNGSAPKRHRRHCFFAPPGQASAASQEPARISRRPANAQARPLSEQGHAEHDGHHRVHVGHHQGAAGADGGDERAPARRRPRCRTRPGPPARQPAPWPRARPAATAARPPGPGRRCRAAERRPSTPSRRGRQGAS